jgi:ABC-2 type transport system permease protein
MNPINEFLIRVSSFVRKETAEILRQPKLVATLILGPFLILFIFGIGYNNSIRKMRTVMVIPQDSKIEEEIREIAGRLGGAVNLVDFVGTRSEATEMLDNDQADLILVTPADPFGDVKANQHAQMEVIHHEIDPLEQMFVNTLERAYVEEVNRLIMIRSLDKAKDESEEILARVQKAHADAMGLQQDLQAGSSEKAAEDIVTLAEDFQAINLALTSSLATFEGVQSMSDEETTESPFDNLLKAEQIMLQLEEFDSDKGSYSTEIAQVAALEKELGLVEEFLSQFTAVDATVLARPFSGKTVSMLTVTFGPIDFYVPGVISLLLQHIAITLAALAIVRERVGGSIELFRAAPINAFETLLGKTISFMILAGFLAIILTGLVIFGLKIPMLGTWFAYAVIILALLYTSLAMGFAISTISETDSQAVQYSMIVLLASIFFSGFFIALHHLLTGVHIVSWLLPATYGTAMLQDVMLRGLPPNFLLLFGLILYGLLLFTFAWWRLRHLMARE